MYDYLLIILSDDCDLSQNVIWLVGLDLYMNSSRKEQVQSSLLAFRLSYQTEGAVTANVTLVPQDSLLFCVKGTVSQTLE